MRLTSWITLATIALNASACSIYQSSGRKQFEANIQGRLATPNLGISHVIASDTCWTQDRSQPLWDFPKESTLVVHHISENQITVCLGRPNETESTPL